MTYDALILGGGPAGATTALMLARAGKRVLVLERSRFPRFRIGESLLPRNMPLLRELLGPALEDLPQIEKRGAAFVTGDGRHSVSFTFDLGLVPGDTAAINLERAPFDAMLLDAARAEGAEVREGRTVSEILRLKDNDVAVTLDDGEQVIARWLVDASGQATVVGRHLGLRKVHSRLRKVAYFGHFENVWRRPGIEGGFPVIVMCDEGWFWLIPLDEQRTSIGLVMDADVARTVDVPADQMLAWGIARCPAVREWTASAVVPATNHVGADFSYRCEPYAGPGYFLVGDAATFVDPVFSTGVCLGMVGGAEVAEGVVAILAGQDSPVRIRRQYIRFVADSSSAFFRLVERYYDHSFRELFLSGEGPLGVHRAILSILAGYVFPRPVFSLRWRLRLFEFFVWLNRHVPIAPRRERFSLLSEPAAEAATPERLARAG